MGTKEKEIEEWLENISAGDTIYVLSTGGVKAKAPATVTNIFIQQNDKETKYVILCSIMRKGLKAPVVLICKECIHDVQGKCMYAYDGCIGFYVLFTSEEACDRYIEREKVYSTVQCFMSGGECLVKRGENDAERPRSFLLSDYSLEDMQRIADVLGTFKMPYHIACMYDQ